MIIVKLISGLGNQLFQYSFARRIALKKNEPLKLDLSFYENQDLREYKLNHFNINAEIATQGEVDHFLWNDKHWSIRKAHKGVEKLLPYYKKRNIREEGRFTYDPNLLKVMNQVYLNGYWQNHRYHQAYDNIIRRELTLKQPHADIIGNISQEIEDNRDAVSLHIRRGDYITDAYARERFGLLSLEYYHQAIKTIKEKLPHPSLYVFSDEIAWAKRNIDFNCITKYIDLKDPLCDLLELQLMSKCKHNIIANSTFSWWGAYLNQNPHKIVIAPKQWIRDPEINKHIEIQFPSWIKL